MKQLHHSCPNCGATHISLFYEVNQTPTNSVLLLPTQEQALNFPIGDIRLGVCHQCSFIYNMAFNPKLTEYSAKYEATQGYSPTFNKFHKKLAQDLIDKFDLHNKDVIEIGCDKGDFITMLCELGGNRGVGFDPAYVPGRHPTNLGDQLSFVADFYSETYADYKADFICCKMTLEHIPDTAQFVNTVRRSIGENDSIVFFQIPNADYVLGDLAFWDVYYEHCSYFTKGSLAHLFHNAGFDVQELWTDYDDQYLMIEARPSHRGAHPRHNGTGQAAANNVAKTLQDVAKFENEVQQLRAEWLKRLAEFRRNGRSFTLWGGGSKGVAFLTTLGLTLADIQYVVDINPNKAGTFMAGTGQKIVLPTHLKTAQPDVVIIMNPIYRNEISQDLAKMGLTPEILTM